MEEGDFLYMVEYDNSESWSDCEHHHEGVFTSPEAAWASIRETRTVSKGKARRYWGSRDKERMIVKNRELRVVGRCKNSWRVIKLRKNTKYPRENPDGTYVDEELEDAPDYFKREIEASSDDE